MRSAAGDRESLTFVLSGLSKLAALPQLKLGFGAMCGLPDLVGRRRRAARGHRRHVLSVATPVQHALPRILAESAGMRARIGERTTANLAALRAELRASAASVLDGRGGLVGDRAPATRRRAR